MKICLFGNKQTTAALLAHLHAAGIAVDTLVTLGDTARAHVDIAGGDATLATQAEGLGVMVYRAEKYALSSPRDVAFFADHRFDIGICTGWQRLIPAGVLDGIGHGVFGWHGSGFHLPNGRGRSPLNWSIRLGLDRVYHNCFRYAAGVDDGQIYETETLKIHPQDDIAALQGKALAHIKASAVRLLQEAARGPLTLAAQPDHPFITFPALSEASGHLPISGLTCDQAINITRSCARPFPGAFVRHRETGAKVRIWQLARATAADRPPDLPVGAAICRDTTLFLCCTDGVVVSHDFSGAAAQAREFACA